MVLYKIYANSNFPAFTAFLGDFADIHSAKAVIAGFNDTQHNIIEDESLFKGVRNFEDLETVCSVKVYKWIVGETPADPERGTLQF